MTTISTSVLELTTDGSKFQKGLTDAEADAKQAFDRIVTQVNAFGRSVDDASAKLNQIGKKAKEQADQTSSALSGITKIAAGVGVAMAGAFAVTKIISAGKEVIDYAGHITDLSAHLKVSTTTVQEWEAAFGPAGVSIETVAKASDKLTENLVGGDKGAVSALEKMGLSVEALKAMKPEDRFIKVADAIGNIKDAGEQLYASKAILGKGGTELLAALDGHLGDTIGNLHNMGVVIDEETIKAADNFGDQLGVLAKQGMALIATVLAPILPLLSMGADFLIRLAKVVVDALKPALEWLVQGFLNVRVQMFEFLAKVADLATRIPILGKYLGGLTTAADFLRDEAARTRVAMDQLGGKTAEAGEKAAVAAPKLLGLGAAAETSEKKAKAADETFKKLVDSIHKIEEVQPGLMDAKFGITDDTLQQIRDYLKAFEKIHEELAKIEQQGIPPMFTQAGLGQVGTHVDVVVDHLYDFRDAIADLGTSFADMASTGEASFTTVSNSLRASLQLADVGLTTISRFMSATDDAGRRAALQAGAATAAQIANQIARQSGAGPGTLAATGAASGAMQGFTAGGFNPYAATAGAVVGGVMGFLEGQENEDRQRDALEELIRNMSPGGSLSAGLAEVAHRAEMAGVGMRQFQHAWDAEDAAAVGLALDHINHQLEQNQASTATIVAGLSRFTAAGRSAADGLAESQESLRGLQTQLASATSVEDQARLQQAIERVSETIRRQQTLVGNLSITSSGAADALAGSVAAAFGQMQRQGTPILDIVNQLDPVVGQLQRQFDTAGVSGGEAFERIRAMVDLAKDDIAGPTISAITGLGQSLEGLKNLGELSQATFTGTTDQIVSMYDAIIAQGADPEAALGDLAEPLQTIWELAQSGAYALDDGTRALLDQAAAAGVVGEARRPLDEQMLTATKRIADATTALARVFGADLPDAMGDTTEAGATMARDLERQAQETARAANEHIGKAFSQTLPDAIGVSQGRMDTLKRSIETLPDREFKIRGTYDGPNVPSLTSIVPMADGGIGRTTGPTVFYSGGNEDYAFSGEGRSFGRNGGNSQAPSGRPYVIQLSGQDIAYGIMPYLHEAADALGVTG